MRMLIASFFTVLALILQSDANPLEALHFLKSELKSGTPKLNCMYLCEKYGQLANIPAIVKEAKDS